MHLVVKTNAIAKAREIAKDKGYHITSVDSSFIPALDEKIEKIVADAVERAHKNGRRTLMGRDV
jgi:histone H3/H4